ncbi:MAG: tRNA dihydrouridine synthase DusB [Oribacterium sp.]|nr:tRNA dihydrouridine synthase DusB [Oribacterium sp.]
MAFSPCDCKLIERLLMHIGNIELKNNVYMAPMAGVTDLPFRTLCHEMGAGLTVTEMVSAKAILYKNKNTEELMTRGGDGSPVAVQLFGSDPEIMSDIAHQIEDRFEIIDVNMGCPVGKIVSNHEGSDLMNHPDLAYEILSRMVKKCHTPITVKFRKGFAKEDDTAVEFAKMAESAGVSAVTVHGRTRSQMYAGKADWDVIRRVKEAVKIPVFGNGDLFEPEDAKRMIEETGCDGVALARGAQGNPWLIKRTVHYLETGELLPKPTISEIIEMIHRHTELMKEIKGEYTTIREMRKHISWYTEGQPKSSKLRAEINTAGSIEKLFEIVDKLAINV